MGYVACPQCGNLNKDTETKCYNCEAAIEAPPPPPPEAPPAPTSAEEDPWAANKDLRVQPLSPSSGGDPSKARFKDLASRYEAKPVPKLDSNVMQGIRAGIPAGLIAGVMMGVYRKANPRGDEMTRLLVRKYPKMAKDGSQVLVYSIGFDLFLGLFIGAFLGLSNLLCFIPEASTRGAIIGALASAIMIYFAGTSYVGLLIGAANGLVIAGLAAFIERKLIRRA